MPTDIVVSSFPEKYFNVGRFIVKVLGEKSIDFDMLILICAPNTGDTVLVKEIVETAVNEFVASLNLTTESEIRLEKSKFSLVANKLLSDLGSIERTSCVTDEISDKCFSIFGYIPNAASIPDISVLEKMKKDFFVYIEFKNTAKSGPVESKQLVTLLDGSAVWGLNSGSGGKSPDNLSDWVVCVTPWLLAISLFSQMKSLLPGMEYINRILLLGRKVGDRSALDYDIEHRKNIRSLVRKVQSSKGCSLQDALAECLRVSTDADLLGAAYSKAHLSKPVFPEKVFDKPNKKFKRTKCSYTKDKCPYKERCFFVHGDENETKKEAFPKLSKK
jgi:hypothetical protein